jgi:hypothetical protein
VVLQEGKAPRGGATHPKIDELAFVLDAEVEVVEEYLFQGQTYG